MIEVQSFVQLLKTLPRDWRAVVDRRLQPLGLSQAKWQILLFLYRADGPRTQTEIADYLQIESPTLVRQLDRLATDGWIERKSCPGDRRARHIVLMPQARKLSAKIEAIALEVRGQLLAGVSPAELAQCYATLQRIQATTQQLLAAPIAEPVRKPAKASVKPAAKPAAAKPRAARRA